MVAAVLLDRLIGDPRRWLHPVQVMGWCVTRLRGAAEGLAGDRPGPLRLAGGAVTVLLVAASGLAGWVLEQLARRPGPAPLTAGTVAVLLLALASCLAGTSLERAVRAVLTALETAPRGRGTEEEARRRLAPIVGRDTAGLDRHEILRATAETASENGVDGLFAPLFWMLTGSLLQGLVPLAPGPLSLAWSFKAASTLDSMLGYRRGRLRWLGTAGARLDDVLTWLPCRLTAASLPLAAGRPQRMLPLLRAALRDGAADPSPNAGVSQAAYAHLAGVRLGGRNRYRGVLREKPLLNRPGRPVAAADVRAMLAWNRRLPLIWLAAVGLLNAALERIAGLERIAAQ